MADTLHRIAAVSPELAVLLRKVKGIYVITGGKVNMDEKKGSRSAFDAKRFHILNRIDKIDRLVDTRDNSGFSEDSRDLIRVKNELRQEFQLLEKDAEEIIRIQENDMGKKKKPTAEELEERNTFLADMQKEFARTYQQVRGRALPKAGGGSEFAAMTADEVISGAARNVRREKVTAAQQQVLLEINEEQKVQDELLDMMSGTLENLKQLAHTIHDEVEMQNKVLDDTIEKVDKTSQQLDRVNDRMKDTLEKVNAKSTKICAYLICIIILLALLLVIYNMWRKSKRS